MDKHDTEVKPRAIEEGGYDSEVHNGRWEDKICRSYHRLLRGSVLASSF